MTIPAEQQDVVRFLSGLAGGPPRETHISAVFIGSDTVWKLKKAVNSKSTNRGHLGSTVT
jgi:uncharacterized protein